MKTRLEILLVLALVIGGTGCYNAAARTKERLEAKVELFMETNHRSPTAEEVAVLRTEAKAEEIAFRSAEISDASQKAVGAVGAATTGNLVAAGILGIGALMTFLGLNRKAAPKVVPPSPPPGGVA